MCFFRFYYFLSVYTFSKLSFRFFQAFHSRLQFVFSFLLQHLLVFQVVVALSLIFLLDQLKIVSWLFFLKHFEEKTKFDKRSKILLMRELLHYFSVRPSSRPSVRGPGGFDKQPTARHASRTDDCLISGMLVYPADNQFKTAGPGEPVQILGCLSSCRESRLPPSMGAPILYSIEYKIKVPIQHGSLYFVFN